MPSKRNSLLPPALPAAPPPTDREIAAAKKIAADLQDLVAMLEQRCLDDAVLLAQEAARGRGPLVDHFRELGRRYAKLLDAPQKPTLRVVMGGVE